jgi:hypothetical protein
LKKKDNQLQVCPNCLAPTTGFSLFAMNFNEIDEAKKSAALTSSKAADKRGRKRKNSVVSQDEGSVKSIKTSKGSKPRKNSTTAADSKEPKEGSDLRTGRWTGEEMAFCDMLIICFKDGLLPVAEGTKLNDFLASVLKSKQSRHY